MCKILQRQISYFSLFFLFFSCLAFCAITMIISSAQADTIYIHGGGGGGGGGGTTGIGGGGAGGYIGTTENPADFRAADGTAGGGIAGSGGSGSRSNFTGMTATPGYGGGENGTDGTLTSGGGTRGGDGGKGGNAFADYSHMTAFTSGDGIYVIGGSGGTTGNGGTGGSGGNGGNASLIWNAASTYNIGAFGVLSGAHGNEAAPATGGRGGYALFEMLNGSLNVNGNVQISANDNYAYAELLSMQVTGSTTSIYSSDAFNATLRLNATGAAFVSSGALTINNRGDADGSFIAPNADSISVARGIELNNTTFFSTTAGKALFDAPKAVVTVANGNIVVTSTVGGFSPNGQAVFIAKEAHASGNINVTSGTGSAQVTILGERASAAGLSITSAANGNNAGFIASNASLRAGTLTISKHANAIGEVTVDVKTLDVTQNDTALNITGTTAAFSSGSGAGVYFGTVELGDSNSAAVRTLDATNAAPGAYRIGQLTVNGLSNSADSQHWAGDLRVGVAGAVGGLHFNLPGGFDPANYADGGVNSILSVPTGTGNVYLNPGTKVSMAPYPGENPFKLMQFGDKFQLAKADLVQDNIGTALADQTITLGARDYLFRYDVNSANNALLATLIGNKNVGPAYLEPGVASLAGLNLLSDLEMRAMNNTFKPATNSQAFDQDGRSIGIMFAGEYAHQRLNTGSHVDVDYFNVVLGPAFRFKADTIQAGFTVFGEAGYGDYSTYNNFGGLNVVGDGSTKYVGGGAGVRVDSLETGLYADASARIGSVSFDQDLRDRSGAGYDINTMYYGAHLGLGRIFDFAENGRLDIYARGLWTHIEGDDATTDADEDLNISNIDSITARLGARYDRELSQSVTGYAGAAAEYEFDGRVDGNLDGRDIGDDPELQGFTGIGELGVKIDAAENLSFDLGVQGYVGKREGVGGTVMLNYSF